MKFRLQNVMPSIVLRRRERQSQTVESCSAWSLELVQLRVRLLVAMAANDGHVVPVEREAIEEVIDRSPLPIDDRAYLRDEVARLIVAPPRLDPLLDALAHFRAEPALARALVTDLVRVAAVDLLEHPRERELLDRVCAAVGLDPVAIPVPGRLATPPPTRRPERRAASTGSVAPDRLREIVRQALESSYAEEQASNVDRR
ncbi:MAG: TerB family tellurite resistance protein [Thermoleophilia bacterium]|nr:TerB family tellurite resistance protein [Thermoleophilia bacterium]